ncbi:MULTISPECIES: nicotinamide riboside transporter PnuC [unclassified Lactobacillus]|nr:MULTISPECIES: nicotinamide riboside transporter PnuC [unclassified Lactobacillus]RMC24402.1 nicotinamide mononucleotide transporter [Lactobacillus sp. ESL0247]RMC28541.1 nicotinamide mononucleotide transporter [Lactobacillus sp. ESL0246]RMC31732.1 nicotinamide mononucleotide transporter [Lactobacillus sp. ESL0245]
MKLQLNTDIFRLKWYINQLRGWSFKTYMLLMLGIGIIIGTTISSPLNILAVVTMIAAIMGFTCTLAITNAKQINGVLGLLSAIIYIIISIYAKNYANIVLQASYIILLDLPVLLLPVWKQETEKSIRGMGLLQWLLTAIFFAIVTSMLYYMDTQIFISPRPWIDATAGAIGITGSLLCTMRFREQYYFWTIQGIMSIILWGVTAFQGDANLTLFITYILYLSNDLLAFTDKHIHWFH